MDRSTSNHRKSGDTNPKGRSRSPLLELYARSLKSEREEKIGHRASADCGGRQRLCYTLDEGKERERETTNCPPKRGRSSMREGGIVIADSLEMKIRRASSAAAALSQAGTNDSLNRGSPGFIAGTWIKSPPQCYRFSAD